MRIIKFFIALGLVLHTFPLFSQEEEEWRQQMEQYQPEAPEKSEMIRKSGMLKDSGDILLDYRGLMQQIDQMRQHEQQVLQQLEDLTKSFEGALKKIEQLEDALNQQRREFQEWYEKKEKERDKALEGVFDPVEIKGTVTAPSDRYYSR